MFHLGHKNPLALKSIMARTGMSDRAVKDAVRGLRRRHNVPVGSARGKRNLPVGYFICVTLEDRDIAAHPFVEQFVDESHTIRAIYGDDRRFRELLGQLALPFTQPRA